MIKVKLAWDWTRFYLFINKTKDREVAMLVANLQFRPFGFELYRGPTSVILYLELVIGTLMIKLSK
jgi:hypothetical protein